MQEQMPQLYKLMLVERNQRWLPQLERLFASPGVELVVVGSAHLTGPDGLISQLIARVTESPPGRRPPQGASARLKSPPDSSITPARSHPSPGAGVNNLQAAIVALIQLVHGQNPSSALKAYDRRLGDHHPPFSR